MLSAVISICRSRDAVQLGANGSDVDERLGLAQPPLGRPFDGGLEQPLVFGFDPRR
jgi:hypothetical protein